MKEQEKDPINPAHYQDIVPGYQYIDTMEYILKPRQGLIEELRVLEVPEDLIREVEAQQFIGLLRGQSFKYQMRLGKKDAVKQESQKATWYSNYLVAFLEKMGWD